MAFGMYMHYCPPQYYVGGQYCYRCGEFYLAGTLHTCKDKNSNNPNDNFTYSYTFYFPTKEEIDTLKTNVKTLESKVEILEKQMEKLTANIDFYFRASSMMDRVDTLIKELERDRTVQDDSV
jgi:outer membrane murein-binding lipoprotein Lpp